jgi:pantetheine-phosphate adenylyltransferase
MPTEKNDVAGFPASQAGPKNSRTAVCPGTYDPVTLGHLDIITRASRLFDEVIVAVVNASVRKNKALFDIDQRMGFIKEAAGHLPNIRVEPFDVLVVEFARRNGAAAIVKGLRAISDFEYETEMTQLNRLQAPEIESVFIMASPQYSFLSSSGVKELAIFGADISELVPPNVEGPLQEALAR